MNDLKETYYALDKMLEEYQKEAWEAYVSLLEVRKWDSSEDNEIVSEKRKIFEARVEFYKGFEKAVKMVKDEIESLEWLYAGQ